ncbi:hypothetical protein [Microbacterium sp.]|uniref:hypothetical protein n=1 Tax=Microbacterium sp. TaxID=51671 RepID=UPI003F976725
MNVKKAVARTCGAFLLGTVMAVAGAGMAIAAEHDATTTDGVAEVQVDFGTDFADRSATVLVLDADADPDAPAESDIAYVAEVLTNAEGVAAFRASLPDGLDYWLASTVDGGDRYVAMLDGSGDGDDGGDGGGDGGGGGGGDGESEGKDDGGSADGGSGGNAENDAASTDGDLATTGIASWVLPSSLLAACGLIAAGTALVRRRRARL